MLEWGRFVLTRGPVCINHPLRGAFEIVNSLSLDTSRLRVDGPWSKGSGVR